MTATDGQEALAPVEARRPDVMVFDWLMPGLDGIRVVERLRATHDETMVLMLMARDAIEDRVEGLESGADDYLVKPFAPAPMARPTPPSTQRRTTGSPHSRCSPMARSW